MVLNEQQIFFKGALNQSIQMLESSQGSLNGQLKPANLNGINYLTGDNRVAIDSKNPFRNLSRHSREEFVEQASGETILEPEHVIERLFTATVLIANQLRLNWLLLTIFVYKDVSKCDRVKLALAFRVAQTVDQRPPLWIVWLVFKSI